jgi:hypothetical protein
VNEHDPRSMALPVGVELERPTAGRSCGLKGHRA